MGGKDPGPFGQPLQLRAHNAYASDEFRSILLDTPQQLGGTQGSETAASQSRLMLSMAHTLEPRTHLTGYLEGYATLMSDGPSHRHALRPPTDLSNFQSDIIYVRHRQVGDGSAHATTYVRPPPRPGIPEDDGTHRWNAASPARL